MFPGLLSFELEKTKPNGMGRSQIGNFDYWQITMPI